MSAKQNYYEHELQLCKNHTMRKWQLLNEFLHSTKSRSKVTSVHVNILTTASDVANDFNVHFSSGFTVSPSSCYVPPFSRTSQSLFLFPTCASEVCSVISGLKATGPGLDNFD